MKLKELIGILYENELIDLEVVDETYPEEVYFDEIVEKYPHYLNYEVISILSTSGGGLTKLFVGLKK